MDPYDHRRDAIRRAQESMYLDAAMHSIWLHGDWRWITQNMTTGEKEAVADAVERYGAWLDLKDPVKVDRWWRDDS